MDPDETRRQDDAAPRPATVLGGGRLRATARAANAPLHYPARGVVEYAPAGDLGEIAIGAPVERGHGGPVVGSVVGIERTDSALVVDMEITDPDTLAAIAAGGLPHVSADYTALRIDADGAQREVKIRAIALVPRGRCGDACSVRTDADGTRRDCEGCGGACYASCARGAQRPSPFLESAPMQKIKIAGKEYVAGSAEAAAAMEAEGKRLDALDAKAKAEASRQLRAKAKAATGLDVRQDAPDTDIMIETVKKIAPGLDLSSASPDYVAGAFACAIHMALDMKGKDEEPGPEDAPEPMPAEAPRQDAAATGAAAVKASVFQARKDAATQPTAAPGRSVPRDVAARQAMIKRSGQPAAGAVRSTILR